MARHHSPLPQKRGALNHGHAMNFANVSNQPTMSPGRVLGEVGERSCYDESCTASLWRYASTAIGINSISIDATPVQGACEGVDDRRRVARATALANKPTARFQGPPDASDDDVRLGHPVQSRIGKHSIKFLLEWQGLPIHNACIQPQRLSRRDHGGTGINAHDLTPQLNKLPGEGAIATP